MVVLRTAFQYQVVLKVALVQLTVVKVQPKLPEITMSHDTSSKFEESEDTLKSGMETSVEMDNSTDVEMADS